MDLCVPYHEYIFVDTNVQAQFVPLSSNNFIKGARIYKNLKFMFWQKVEGEWIIF